MQRRDLLRWGSYLLVAGLVGCRRTDTTAGTATADAAGRAVPEPSPPRPPATSGPLLPRDGIEPGEFDEPLDEPAEEPAREETDAESDAAETDQAAEAPEGEQGAGEEDTGQGELDEPEELPEPDEPEEPAESEEPAGETSGPVRVEVLCRDALGLRSARSGGPTHSIGQLTLHHTAVALGANRNAPGRMRSHQSFHLDQGWVDIAYHFGVDANGNVYELRDPAVAGETFTEYDPAGHFLVVCEGDYDVEAPTDAMLQATAEILAYGALRYGVGVDTLTGHRDHASITCPGSNLYARLGDLRQETSRLTQAAVERHDRCGSDGRDRVAAIEAG